MLLTVFRAGFDGMLQALLDDPEMRALLAASPRAGRLLRPLWRKLSPHPLPEVLRLPPRPPRPKPTRRSRRRGPGQDAADRAGQTLRAAARDIRAVGADALLAAFS